MENQFNNLDSGELDGLDIDAFDINKNIEILKYFVQNRNTFGFEFKRPQHFTFADTILSLCFEIKNLKEEVKMLRDQFTQLGE